MGCNIHIIIERKNEVGAWERVSSQSMPECFANRCYALFGILADVRNGTGFAGLVTGDSWPSIAPNRDLPEDATYKHGDWLGDHSFTWIGLGELRAFDWDGVIRGQRGLVRFPVWQEWQ